MPVTLVVDSPEQAIRLLLDELETIEAEDLERIVLKSWASSKVKILGDFHSELNGPFLDAYSEINNDVLRLFAIAKYGSSDIRVLKQDDIDFIDFKVKVEEGSSEVSDNLWKLLEKLSVEMVGKMTGTEIIITVLGLAVIGGTAWGINAWLEGRKETRLEELRSEERKQAVAAMQFASTQQTEQFRRIADLMSEQGEIGRKALETALVSNEQLLKAASRTGPVLLGDARLDRSESKELRGSPRRTAAKKIIEQYMRVVDMNTSDPTATSLIIEDPESGRQHKITFRDRLIDINARQTLLKALDARGMAWFRLSVKEVEGEPTAMEILSVAEREPDEANVTPIRPLSGPAT